jgi:CheY-like chemotaxis protein
LIEIRCPACKADLSRQQLGVTECPICGSELNVVIDLREPEISRTVPTVLVVHDDRDIRQKLSSVLEENDFELAGVVSNGPDAVLVSQRVHPDYVIVERLMPAISGEETARLIRDLSPRSVIVSFTDAPEDRPVWADLHLSKGSLGSAGDLLRSIATARSENE